MGNCRPETRAAGDGGCFAAALASLYKFGGVLEHPAHSRAWGTFNLPRPVTGGWSTDLYCRGYATEVDQRLYGHEARKPTWLYYVGADPAPMRWGRGTPGARTVGRGWGGGREHLRAATPPEFRDVLLEMARLCAVNGCNRP